MEKYGVDKKSTKDEMEKIAGNKVEDKKEKKENTSAKKERK